MNQELRFTTSRRPQTGDVLLDTATLWEALRIIKSSSPVLSLESQASLFQLVEALVLNEHIFVDKTTYEFEYNENFSRILEQSELKDFNDIINGVELVIPDTDNKLSDLVDHFSTQIKGFAQVFEDSSYASKRQSSYRDPHDVHLCRSRHSERTVHYFVTSCLLEIPYIPSPLRTQMLETILIETPKSLNRANYVKRYTEIAKDMLLGSTNAKINEMNSALGTDYFVLDVPVFVNYVMRKAKERKNIIKAAMDIRESKECRDFRKIAAEFDLATQVDDRQQIIAGIEELKQHAKRLQGVAEEPAIGLQIGFPLSIAFDPLLAIRSIKMRRKRHLIFLTQIYKEGLLSRGVLDNLATI